MAGLLDTIRGAISAETISGLSRHLGESPENTSNALNSAIPAVLAAMAGRARTDPGGLASLLTGALGRGNPLDHMAELADPPAAGVQPDDGGLANGLLGSSFGTVAANLAERFGLKVESLRTLLGLAGLLGAGGVARALNNNITPQGLTSLFDRERPAIEAALPAGLGSLLGLGTGAAGASAARAADATADTARDTAAAASGGLGKLLPWLLLAAAAIALILVLRSCNTQPEPTTTAVETSETEIVEPAGNLADPNVPATVPAPAAIPAGSGVISETRAGRPALVVYFDTGKSDVSKDLTAASASVKSYLDANPGSTLAVSGFNDPTGNAAANAALSKRRAEEVSKALAATGIAAEKIALVKPVETSGTGDTNAESRRVEVTIAQ